MVASEKISKPNKPPRFPRLSVSRGIRLSKMPLANAAAIATAGSFMWLFAIAQAFRYEMFQETDQTDASLKSRNDVWLQLVLWACDPCRSRPQGRAPEWKDRRIDTRFQAPQDLPAVPQSPRLNRHVGDLAR